jgi:hypothetical protein
VVDDVVEPVVSVLQDQVEEPKKKKVVKKKVAEN